MALIFSRFMQWLPRLGVAASLGLALLLSSCSSSSKKPAGIPSDLPAISVYGKARTPPHSMSRADYPFDSNGNYVTAWAAEGRSSAGPSDYRSTRSSHHDDDDSPPPRRKPASSSSSSSSTKKKVASAPPAKKRVVDDDDPPPAAKKKTSTASSPAKKSSGGGGTKHVVKSSDSLWSLAKKYGTTVEKIKAANGLKGTNIRDGASLTIPK